METNHIGNRKLKQQNYNYLFNDYSYLYIPLHNTNDKNVF